MNKIEELFLSPVGLLKRALDIIDPTRTVNKKKLEIYPIEPDFGVWHEENCGYIQMSNEEIWKKNWKTEIYKADGVVFQVIIDKNNSIGYIGACSGHGYKFCSTIEALLFILAVKYGEAWSSSHIYGRYSKFLVGNNCLTAKRDIDAVEKLEKNGSLAYMRQGSVKCIKPIEQPIILI